MAGRASRMGVGDAMTVVALAAPVFAAARFYPGSAALLAALLGLAWHRVQMLEQVAEAFGRPGTILHRAGWWLDSLLCALVVLTLGMLAAMLAGGLVGALAMGLLRGVLRPPMRPVMFVPLFCVALAVAVAATAGGLPVALLLGRGLWPGRDGRIPWRSREPKCEWIDEEPIL